MRLEGLFEEGGIHRIAGVVDAAQAACFVAALEASDAHRYAFSTAFEAYSVGRILDQEPDLPSYFGAVEAYRATLAACGGAELPATALARLGGAGSPIAVARHPDHGLYGASTLRCLPPGGLIPPHCETEQLEGGQYAHLRTLVDPRDMLSWFVVLQAPEGGGALARYDVTRDSERGRAIYADRMRARELLADGPPVLLEPEVGQLVVFAGGRTFHEVRPVVGARARWTLGGFLCRARSGGYLAFS